MKHLRPAFLIVLLLLLWPSGVGAVAPLPRGALADELVIKLRPGAALSSQALARGPHAVDLNRMLLGACLAGIPLLGTWGALQWAPKWAIALSHLLPGNDPVFAKEYTQIAASLGAIIGTILAALAGGYIGRRPTYALLCAGSFASLVYMYLANDAYGTKLLASVFVAGGVTAAFYGWFPTGCSNRR